MNPRIKACFEQLAASGRRALIPYIMVGHPRVELTAPTMHAIVQAGADLIELGVPFSDPMADGPAIQRASECALAQGIGMSDVLVAVRTFRERDAVTPIVLMGYANPIERMGTDKFVSSAAEAGVDGLIVVDYPPEESESFVDALKSHQIDPVFLLAPTSTDARIEAVCRMASGYVYYVALTGVTGAGHLDVDHVRAGVERVRRASTVPIGVGFGIRDGETAARIGAFADAVIIGTRMIQLLEDGDPAAAPDRAAAFIRSVRSALDGESSRARAGEI